MCPLAKLIELGGDCRRGEGGRRWRLVGGSACREGGRMVGCETAGRREVQLSDSFTRTPPAMEHTAVPRISIEFASPSKEKVVQIRNISHFFFMDIFLQMCF